jgi:hypothetical protein
MQEYFLSIVVTLPTSTHHTVRIALDSVLQNLYSTLSHLKIADNPQNIDTLNHQLSETPRHNKPQISPNNKKFESKPNNIRQEPSIPEARIHPTDYIYKTSISGVKIRSTDSTPKSKISKLDTPSKDSELNSKISKLGNSSKNATFKPSFLEADENSTDSTFKHLNYKSRHILNDEERIRFVKRVDKERREREEKRRRDNELFQQRIEKMIIKEEIERKEREEKLIQERNKRVEEIHDKLEALKQKEAHRLQLKKDVDKTFKVVQTHIPLYRKLEANFKEEELSFITQELEKLKEKIQPISLDEIKQHEKKYLKTFKSKTSLDSSLVQSHLIPKYPKTKAAEIAKQEVKLIKGQAAQKDNELKELYNKRKKYGKLVSEMFRPCIIKSTKISPRDSPISKSTTPQPIKKSIKIKPSSNISELSSSHQSTRIKKVIKSPSFSPPKLKKLEMSVERIDKSADYLGEQKVLREKVAKSIISSGVSKVMWDDLKTDEQLNFEEKLQSIQNRAKLNEKKARKIEELLKGDHSLSSEAIEATDAITDVYLKSIKAKIALLNSISKPS